MKARLNLWLEKEGEVVFSIWRMALLQAVADSGSISGAATALNVHYRTAWQKIQEMESGLGQKLVETQIGGRRGGGASLTPLAQELIVAFTQFSQAMEQQMTQRFTAILAPLLAKTHENPD